MKMILIQIEVRQARMLMALPMRYTDIWFKMEIAKPSVQMKTLTDIPYDKLSLKSKTQQSRKFNMQRKKNTTATLTTMSTEIAQHLNIVTVHKQQILGVNGSRIKRWEVRHTSLTVCCRQRLRPMFMTLS